MVPFPNTSISLKIINPAFIRESTLQHFFDDLLHKVGDLFFTLCVWQSLPLLSRMLDPVPRALSSSSFFLYFNLFSITPQLLSPATVIEGTVETIVISPFRSPSIFFSNPSYLPLIVRFFLFFLIFSPSLSQLLYNHGDGKNGRKRFSSPLPIALHPLQFSFFFLCFSFSLFLSLQSTDCLHLSFLMVFFIFLLRNTWDPCKTNNNKKRK